jgi:mannosyltransferase
VYFNELIQRSITQEVPCRTIVYEGASDRAALLTGDVEMREYRIGERFRNCTTSENAILFHSSYYRRSSRSDIPTVVTVHDFIYERFRSGPAKWVHMWQKHAAIRQAQSLICISESTRDDLMHFVGVRSDQTVHVIPNGVSNTFAPVAVLPAARPFVLFVGERRGYKNFSLMLAGLEHLPDLELHCVGGGPLRDEEFTGYSPNLRARVRHLGFVTDDKLNFAYNQAVCLVYPSRYEGFGIPVVEAMKAGCPVVSVNCKAVIEIGGDALERLEQEDPLALAAAVLRLCEPSHRAQRVSAGLQRATMYDWGRCHDQTLSVYRSLSVQPV